jgi:3-carboxy-cis,cis-muconate cycloisomerase
MLDNPHRTRSLIASERLAAEPGGLLGRTAARKLLDPATRQAADEQRHFGDVLTGLIAEDPALTGRIHPARLRALGDPATGTGSAPLLVDHALRGE